MDITKTFIIITTLVIAGFDIFVLVKFGPEATISRITYHWASDFPIVAFALGVVFGHIFWPQQFKMKEDRSFSPEK